MKLVYIRWIDSNSSRGVWNSPADILTGEQALECYSVGWLLKRSRVATTVVAHVSKTGQMGGDLTIPNKAILQFVVLKGHQVSV